MDIAKPVKCEVRIEQVGDELMLRRWGGSFFLAGFFLLVLTACTAACTVFTGELIREPTGLHVLFCLPFYSLWVSVSCLMVLAVSGTEHLHIEPVGVEYRHRTILGVVRQRVPLEEIKTVALYSTVPSGRSGTINHGLRIEAGGKPIRFAQGIDPSECLRIADLIHRRLQELSPDRVIVLQTDEVAEASMPPEVLQSEGTALKPPSDGEIELSHRRGRREFIGKTRRFTLVQFIAVTFLNFIVNGFVAVFILLLIGPPQQWAVLLMLIPWGIAGFKAIVIWLIIGADLLQRRKWTIGPGELTARTSILGIGRTRHYDLLDLDRIELRRASIEEGRKRAWSGQDAVGDRPFSLGLVERGGDDLLVIGNLTEGEARWMGGHISESLKGLHPGLR